jgi:hypothetical protein
VRSFTGRADRKCSIGRAMRASRDKVCAKRKLALASLHRVQTSEEWQPSTERRRHILARAEKKLSQPVGYSFSDRGLMWSNPDDLDKPAVLVAGHFDVLAETAILITHALRYAPGRNAEQAREKGHFAGPPRWLTVGVGCTGDLHLARPSSALIIQTSATPSTYAPTRSVRLLMAMVR